MPTRRGQTRFYLAAIISTILAGCSSGKVELAPVTGTVSFDGKPLPYGTITFESTGQRPATGRIVNGAIVEVTTYQTGDGAPLGMHKVSVTSNEEAGSAVAANPGASKTGANYMSGKSLIPAMYNDPSTSGLNAEFKSGENTVAFQLSSKPPKSGK